MPYKNKRVVQAAFLLLIFSISFFSFIGSVNEVKAATVENIEVMAPGGDRIAAFVNRRVVRLKKGAGGALRATIRVEGEELSLHCEEKPNYFTRIALYDVE